VRRGLGKVIFDLQKGEKLSMPLSRPMSSVAPGVEELRLRDRSGIYRIFYYSKLADSDLISMRSPRRPKRHHHRKLL
jgi:phage-related protein